MAEYIEIYLFFNTILLFYVFFCFMDMFKNLILSTFFWLLFEHAMPYQYVDTWLLW